MELSDAPEKIRSDRGSIPGPSDYATPGPTFTHVYTYYLLKYFER